MLLAMLQYIHSCLNFVQKYVQILVSRQSMFQKATYFPRAMLKEAFPGGNLIKILEDLVRIL